MPSTEAPFANLPSAVRELVVESSSGRRLGESDEEKKEIASWIVKASDGSFVSRSSLPVSNWLPSWNGTNTHGSERFL